MEGFLGPIVYKKDKRSGITYAYNFKFHLNKEK